jgi:hypothetical protein
MIKKTMSKTFWKYNSFLPNEKFARRVHLLEPEDATTYVFLVFWPRNIRDEVLHSFKVYNYFQTAVAKVDIDHAFGDEKFVHYLSPFDSLSVTVTEYSWFPICIQLCQGLHLFPCIDIYNLYI